MAKKKEAAMCCEHEIPGWWCILVVLVGLFFLLKDMGYVMTDATLWPVVIILIGLKMCAKTYAH